MISIRRGWASDYARRKFDIEMDASDLVSLLAEAGDENPGETVKRVTTGHVYQILDAACLVFMYHSLAKTEQKDSDEQKGMLRLMSEQRALRDKFLALYVPALAARLAEEQKARAAAGG